MRQKQFVLLCAVLIGGVTQPTCSGYGGHEVDPSAIRVRVRTDKPTYFLGEAVVVKARITNVSGKSLELPTFFMSSDQTSWHFKVWTGMVGQELDAYRSDISSVTECSLGLPQVVKSGDSVSTHSRVYYKDGNALRLAFPQVGDYIIKMSYGRAESNRIQISIRKSPVAEAALFRQITRPHIQKFLQSGIEWGIRKEQHGQVADEVIQLLRDHPKSVYAGDLRWALNHFYENSGRLAVMRKDFRTDKRLTAIREVLDIKLPKVPVLFEEDPRLTLTISYAYPMLTPMADIFRDIEDQSGVPLHLHPDLHGRGMVASRQQTKTLREFMDQRDSYKAKWVKSGNGYQLVPDELPMNETK